MQAALLESRQLNNGLDMPVLGLGVWQMMPGQETLQAVGAALDLGYRHIDTAKIYRNEVSVGEAVRAAEARGIDRQDIFVATKLFPTDAARVEKALEESLQRLDIGYLDLYLIHWPVPIMGDVVWREMEKLYAQKKMRAIGVSNYSLAQLKHVLDIASVRPAVNQVEFNVFSHDDELLNFCMEHHIVLEAYSPLNRGTDLDNRTLVAMASAYGKTAPQILLRWALQKGTVVIPKSAHRDRLEQNSEIFDFEISADDMDKLDSLG